MLQELAARGISLVCAAWVGWSGSRGLRAVFAFDFPSGRRCTKKIWWSPPPSMPHRIACLVGNIRATGHCGYYARCNAAYKGSNCNPSWLQWPTPVRLCYTRRRGGSWWKCSLEMLSARAVGVSSWRPGNDDAARPGDAAADWRVPTTLVRALMGKKHYVSLDTCWAL